jgi:hypothetical protein
MEPTLSLHLDRVRALINSDPEFTLQARHLDAAIRVVIGTAQTFRLVLSGGKLTEIDPTVTPFDSYDIQLAGSQEQWTALLAAAPIPFYQDFYPAMLHHGFRIEGNMEMIMAYYPAIRRLGDLFRAVANDGVSA